MADYIERQAAIDTVAFGITIASAFNKDTGVRIDLFANENAELTKAINRIQDLPSADVVPVVRCKDCKHYYFADNRIPQEQRYVCEISGEIWNPDDFCSYGEREE